MIQGTYKTSWSARTYNNCYLLRLSVFKFMDVVAWSLWRWSISVSLKSKGIHLWLITINLPEAMIGVLMALEIADGIFHHFFPPHHVKLLNQHISNLKRFLLVGLASSTLNLLQCISTLISVFGRQVIALPATRTPITCSSQLVAAAELVRWVRVGCGGGCGWGKCAMKGN